LRTIVAMRLALCRCVGTITLVIISLSFLAACGRGAAPHPSPSDAFVLWAKSHAVPLRTVDVSGDDADLRPLQGMVGSARIVALGEAAHGAHEPLALRNRIFKFLVERMGFTAIAIESGITESQRVQEYVLGGDGAARQVVHDDLTWGFGEYEENVALVQWMHDYNADPAHSHKIRFYGVDLSAGEDAAFGRARITIDAALSYLARVDTASARGMRAAVEPYLERFSSAGYPTLASAERDRVSSAIDRIIALLESRRAMFVASTSAEDYEWALRNARAARQLDAFFRVAPPPTADGSIPPTLAQAMNVRDSAMAGNLEWVLEREGTEGRVMLFAHDAHVMSGTVTGPLWKSFAKPVRQMGVHLRKRLGQQLFTIATSSAHNAADLPKAALDSVGIDASLARMRMPLFLLGLPRPTQAPAAAAWLAQRRSLRINFDTHVDVVPDSAFDALLYVDTLTKSGSKP
jgi:erythromycin esterase